jgi:hypothetical protein
MIAVTCDMCGEKLNPLNNLIDLEFTCYCPVSNIKKERR